MSTELVAIRPVPGGQGDGADDMRGMTRADIGLAAQAIRGRWPIRPERRQDIIDTLTAIACSPGRVDPRTAVMAAKALLDADKVNLEAERRQPQGPEAVEVAPGKFRWDFSTMTDEQLEAFIRSKQ